MATAQNDYTRVPSGAPLVPNRDEWPQRLYLLAETAALVARLDRDALVARFQDVVARLPAETLEACPLQEETEFADLLPLLEPATLTPTLFLSLLAKCAKGKSRAWLETYATDEALFAALGGTESEISDPNCKELRTLHDCSAFYCPDMEAFVALTDLTVVLQPAEGWYGEAVFEGGQGQLHLSHHFGSQEWSAVYCGNV